MAKRQTQIDVVVAGLRTELAKADDFIAQAQIAYDIKRETLTDAIAMLEKQRKTRKPKAVEPIERPTLASA